MRPFQEIGKFLLGKPGPVNKPLLVLAGSAVVGKKTRESIIKHFRIVDSPAIRNKFASPNEPYTLWCSLDSRISSRVFEGSILPSHIVTSSTGITHFELEFYRLHKDKVIKLERNDKGLDKVSSTAELSWALFLQLHMRLLESQVEVLNGVWNRWNYYRDQISSLSIGIVGYGRLGEITAKYAAAFGATIKVWDIDETRLQVAKLSYPNSCVSSLQALLEKSDVVFLHANEQENRNPIITDALLERVRTPFGLINTARGSLVDETSLSKWLNKGKIRFYGADVLEAEYEDWTQSVILKLAQEQKNIVLTPHIGGASFQAAEDIEDILLQKLLSKIS